MSEIERVSQSLSPGDIVQLFQLDLSPIGTNQVLCFTPGPAVTFRGITYASVDIMAEGFEWSGKGKMPQPKLKIGNATRMISALALDFQDLIGARLTRIRTYRQYLDGQSTSDPDAAYDPDIYTVEQKTHHDKFSIEFMLSAAMDQDGRQLPGRMVLRDVCTWRYRIWNPALNAGAGGFDYSRVIGCPYVGTAYFDRLGLPVAAAQDQCGKRISDCKKRFGNNAALPYGGFPGVSRVRAT